MKISFNIKKINKIVSGFLLLLVFMTASFGAYPGKATAQWLTFDGSNFVQNTLTAINTTTSALTSYYEKYKDTVLNRIAILAAKRLIHQMTADVVNWINSGFDGSPAFLQNPGSFFLDVADQVTGEFLAETGGPLVELCSPFSIDIRFALAFKYRPKIQKRYACTLGTIIKNSAGAIENASINGFTAGDFRQGGWPAFISMTTEPQNNPYSAYLSAESDLSWRVGNAQVQQRDELGAGGGFLSWRDPECTAKVKAYQKNVATIKDEDDYLNRASEFEKTPKTDLDCPVLTPGKVIGESLQNNLDGPLRQLELVDDINQIVDALFSQLVTRVLQGGLSTINKKDRDGTSYLDETIKDINSEANPQLQKIKTELIDNTEAYKKNTVEYKQNRDEALNVMLDIKNTYDTAKSCLETKLSSSNSYKNGLDQQIRNSITEINTILNTVIAPKSLDLLSLAKQADERLKTLNDIQSQASAAKTLNDVIAPSQKYAHILANGGVTTGIELVKSRDDLAAVKSESINLKQDASRRDQLCKAIN